MKIRNIVLWGTLILILLVVNSFILREEFTRRTGETVFLQLAPRDPRSLIQGDYMVLNYRLADDVRRRSDSERGQIIIQVSENRIGEYIGIYRDGMTLSDDQLHVQYWTSADGISFGIETFFFREGDAGYYDDARFAEVRIDRNGNVSLIALRDDNLQLLSPPD